MKVTLILYNLSPKKVSFKKRTVCVNKTDEILLVNSLYQCTALRNNTDLHSDSRTGVVFDWYNLHIFVWPVLSLTSVFVSEADKSCPNQSTL